MLVEHIWTGNAYRNFNYLIACPENGQALAVDPLDHQKCLNVAKSNGWDITHVLNTHEHFDHIGGNAEVIAATGARLLAHKNAKGVIPGLDEGLSAGDIIKIGKSVELEALDTPGHTMSHVCLLSRTDQPALFSGDTMFNAGAGNCHNGGHPIELYETFVGQLAQLSDQTLVYPGHDYIANNLKFTLDREPDNLRAKALLSDIMGQDPEKPLVTTISLEKEVNTFFRLQSPTVMAELKETFPDMEDEPSPRTVFLKLRELRNKW